LGGVGGLHLQALARLGIESFHLADPDRFEVPNLNRQFCAFRSTLGRPKVQVAAQTLLEINPGIGCRVFPGGLNAENIPDFLVGLDVVVDGIEAFQIEVRATLYAACRARGIPIIGAGPLGYGASLITFTPRALSFEDYFGIEPGMTRAERLLAYFLGMTPGIPSEIDPDQVDFEGEKGPALASSCLLCAGMAATELLKWATGRGPLAEPGHGLYFDPWRQKTVRIRRKPRLKSLPGRFIAWRLFRRFPGLKRLHEQEKALARSRGERPKS
jgi:molybdopterin/thiamine biosynthesis adenylyltransferase